MNEKLVNISILIPMVGLKDTDKLIPRFCALERQLKEIIFDHCKCISDIKISDYTEPKSPFGQSRTIFNVVLYGNKYDFENQNRSLMKIVHIDFCKFFEVIIPAKFKRSALSDIEFGLIHAYPWAYWEDYLRACDASHAFHRQCYVE